MLLSDSDEEDIEDSMVLINKPHMNVVSILFVFFFKLFLLEEMLVSMVVVRALSSEHIFH